MGAGDAPRSDVERAEKLVRRSARACNRCGSLHRHKRGRVPARCFAVAAIEERSMRPMGGPLRTCMLVVLVGGLSIRPVLKHGPRSLTCVRVGGFVNPRGARKLTGEIPPSRGVHRRPTLSFCEGFECEHTCWDPKDGELCLSRAKPEETLVEARSDTDVQIVRLTWV